MFHILRSRTFRSYVIDAYMSNIFVTIIDIKLKEKTICEFSIQYDPHVKKSCTRRKCDRATPVVKKHALLHGEVSRESRIAINISQF